MTEIKDENPERENAVEDAYYRIKQDACYSYECGLNEEATRKILRDFWNTATARESYRINIEENDE
jgi:hypothetical protein